MALQTIVNAKQALGVVGEIYDDSPRRVNSHRMLTAGKIGNAVVAGAGGVSMGTAGAFAGILINPKTLALKGLAPSLNIDAETQVEAMTFGRVYVAPTNATAVGNAAFVVTATGEIQAGTAGGTVTGATEIVSSKFLTAGNANDVCVLQLTTNA